MVLALTADDTASTTAADGTVIPGVTLHATGIVPAAANRILRWWRQHLDGTWEEVGTGITAQTTTTEDTVDWACPTRELDPSTPATAYTYGVSVRTLPTGGFVFASAVMASPGRLARPGSLPWLIHPTSPELSLPVTLESDTGRRRRALATSQQPYGRQAPVITLSGYRALRVGQVTLNVPRALRGDLARLVDDGTPLYLAQDCGAAETDDAWLFIESVSDDVIAHDILRVVCDYQSVYPARTSPPSVLSGLDGYWWE